MYKSISIKVPMYKSLKFNFQKYSKHKRHVKINSIPIFNTLISDFFFYFYEKSVGIWGVGLQEK